MQLGYCSPDFEADLGAESKLWDLGWAGLYRDSGSHLECSSGSARLGKPHLLLSFPNSALLAGVRGCGEQLNRG